MVRRLEYGTGLSLQEAETRLREVRDEFDRVKGRYFEFGRSRIDMSREDLRTLVDCFGVLLPLGLERSVQEQLLNPPKVDRRKKEHRAKSAESPLYYQITQLSAELMDYLANFPNPGVTRLEGELPL